MWRMISQPSRQQDQVISLLRERGMVRLSELVRAGVTAATVSRMKEKDFIVQLGRSSASDQLVNYDVHTSIKNPLSAFE
jgi:hypothetical protein